MNKFICILILGFCGSFVTAQTYLIKVKPVTSFTWKYANLNGDIVIDCKYYIDVYPFSEDGFAVTYAPKQKQYVIINRRGKEIVTQIKKFELSDLNGYNAKGYSDGLIAIRVMNKWGYMDTLGKIAVPVKYDDLSAFNSGHGIGETKGKYIIVDRHGKETLIEDPSIKEIKEFNDSLAPFFSENQFYGFINTSGKIVVSPQFVSVGDFEQGYTWAKSINGSYGLINKKGEWVIKPEFEILKQIDIESGLAKSKKGDNYGYVNLKGEFIAFPVSDVCDDFKEGLSRARIGKLWGFLNNKGEWAIQPQFQALRDFKNGYAAAKMNKLWGLIDKQGNWVIKPAFSGVEDVIIIK